MEISEKYAHIPGWGADLNPAQRPAYPKERTPPRLEGVHWEQPEPQQETIKVYHSTERPGLTPIFGTSVPPRGISGKLRGYAFRHSENDVRHWMALLAADRINVVEGLADDLLHGHVPNIADEMGLKSELRFNRRGAIRKAALATTIMLGVAAHCMRRRKH
jgi:hypothetical protein